MDRLAAGELDSLADLDLGIGWQDEGYVDWPNRFWIGWLGEGLDNSQNGVWTLD